jgi:hypothetical protein
MWKPIINGSDVLTHTFEEVEDKIIQTYCRHYQKHYLSNSYGNLLDKTYSFDSIEEIDLFLEKLEPNEKCKFKEKK